jgi:hypothetical protein
MPHYKDGTPAQPGDLVVGRGYNVSYQISGVVVGVTPGANTCNIQVAHASRRRYVSSTAGAYVGIGTFPLIDIEYGEAAAFEKVG